MWENSEVILSFATLFITSCISGATSLRANTALSRANAVAWRFKSYISCSAYNKRVFTCSAPITWYLTSLTSTATTLKAATTKSKLSPLLRPAAAYLCSNLNTNAATFCMFSRRAGRSILRIQPMQWSATVVTLMCWALKQSQRIGTMGSTYGRKSPVRSFSLLRTIWKRRRPNSTNTCPLVRVDVLAVILKPERLFGASGIMKLSGRCLQSNSFWAGVISSFFSPSDKSGMLSDAIPYTNTRRDSTGTKVLSAKPNTTRWRHSEHLWMTLNECVCDKISRSGTIKSKRHFSVTVCARIWNVS